MSDLEKRITGDWFDIREASQDLITLNSYFRIPEEEQREQIKKLSFSVEEGIVEYKRATLNPTFQMLENTKYQSLGMDVVGNQIRFSSALLYIVLIQRLFSEGTLKLSREKKKEETFSIEDLAFGDILEEINKRIKENPEFGKNNSVKMILMGVNRYRKERDTMKKLLPTIREENKRSFILNFKKTFDEIIDSIRRNYADILKEENPPTEDNRNILELVSFKKTAPLLASQCQIISKIRSTLSFVKEEKYKTREVLIQLAGERKKILSLLDSEIRMYTGFSKELDPEKLKAAGTGDPASLMSRLICTEIIQFLEKELSYQQALGSS